MATPPDSPIEEEVVLFELEPKARAPKPIPVALEDLCRLTKFTRQEIRVMYRGFKTVTTFCSFVRLSVRSGWAVWGFACATPSGFNHIFYYGEWQREWRLNARKFAMQSSEKTFAVSNDLKVTGRRDGREHSTPREYVGRPRRGQREKLPRTM